MTLPLISDSVKSFKSPSAITSPSIWWAEKSCLPLDRWTCTEPAMALRCTSPFPAVTPRPAPRPAAITSPLPALMVTRADFGTVTVRLTRPLELPSDLTSTAPPLTVTCAASESNIFLASLSELAKIIEHQEEYGTDR